MNPQKIHDNKKYNKMNNDNSCNHVTTNETIQNGRSIFGYMTDSSMYINQNECNNYAPPFLTYIPTGVPKLNIDIDTELRGITRHTTKCIGCKHKPESLKDATNEFTKDMYVKVDQSPHNKQECHPDYSIFRATK